MDPEIKAQIDNMSREEMARIWRFSPVGSEFFTGPHGAYFKTRFDSLGGMTPQVSKEIGWD